MTVIKKIVRAVKSPRQLWEKIRWKIRNKVLINFFAKKVLFIYQNPDSAAHQKIKKQFRILQGLEKGNSFLAGVRMKNMVAGQHVLYQRGFRRDFGCCNLGFENLKMQCSSDSILEAQTFLFGAYAELTVLDLYKKILNKDSVAVDVGANVGFHTVFLARIIGDGGVGQVVAYEPRASLAERLKKNLELNNIRKTRIRNVGVWSWSGKMGFDENDGFNQGVGACNSDSSFKIDVVSLDDDLSEIKNKIDVLKIDVEGGELEVVKGAKKILSKHRPCIVVEYNEPECRSWTLAEIREAIPYPIKTYRIPDNFNEHLSEVVDEDKLSGWNNLLFKPC